MKTMFGRSAAGAGFGQQASQTKSDDGFRQSASAVVACCHGCDRVWDSWVANWRPNHGDRGFPRRDAPGGLRRESPPALEQARKLRRVIARGWEVDGAVVFFMVTSPGIVCASRFDLRRARRPAAVRARRGHRAAGLGADDDGHEMDRGATWPAQRGQRQPANPTPPQRAAQAAEVSARMGQAVKKCCLTPITAAPASPRRARR